MTYLDLMTCLRRQLLDYHKLEGIIINDEPVFYITNNQLSDLSQSFIDYRQEIEFPKDLPVKIMTYLSASRNNTIKIDDVIANVLAIVKHAKIESELH